MAALKRKKNKEKKHMGMRGKLIVSLLLIALMLILSFVLAVLEYTSLNTATFGDSFYRAVMPVFVALSVALLLLVMLLFFILSYYVNPFYKILAALNAYRSFGKKYSVKFDGDDQLSMLNEGLAEITEENIQLRRRIAVLKGKIPSETEI